MPSPPPGIFTGFEEENFEEITGFVGDNIVGNQFDTALANQHTDVKTGNLHGDQSMRMVNGQYIQFTHRRSDIKWEECVVEVWLKMTANNLPEIELYNGATAEAQWRRMTVPEGAMDQYNGLAQLSPIAPAGTWPSGQSRSWSVWVEFGTSGKIKTWVDGIEVLSNTGVNFGDVGVDLLLLRGSSTVYLDDLGWRPRTILVDNVSGSKSDTPTAITGTHTADVYAWENDTTDSASGAGDPLLAADEWRLYLKNLSIAPEETVSGWANNDVITVTGLTTGSGGIKVNAPAANYKMGMEPGSQLYMQQMHILPMPVSAVGTENTDGTLLGGATDRLDALDTTNDGLEVRHTATAESVTLKVTDLSAAENSAIVDIVGIVTSVAALSDGGSPDSIMPRLLDSGSLPQNGHTKALAATNTYSWDFFVLNGSGSLWTTGSLLGGIGATEVGYETA